MSFNAQKGKWWQSDDGLSGGYKPNYYSNSISQSLMSASISFTRPSYVPAIRMPVTNSAFSGHFQLGPGIFGTYGSAEVEVYKQMAKVAPADVIQQKPMVGYLYYEKANDNVQAVMDFVRLNDREVTSNTPVISAPQYSYDVFSIQGEGTGGTIRAYRNDYGYVRDNLTRSRDESFSVGADVSITAGHYGANFNTIKTPSAIGDWEAGNNLKTAIGFKPATGSWENVYFRNPGEISVLHEQQFNRIGGTDLVRFRLGGTRKEPAIDPVLEKFSSGGQLLGTVDMNAVADPLDRKKRTQVIHMFTAGDAEKLALDKYIRNYSQQNTMTADTLGYSVIQRVGGYRKSHHISQIEVDETNGRRYIYGIPVYNTVQKDFTFSVPGGSSPDQETVAFSNADYASGNSPLTNMNSDVDGMVQITETPAYAHSFLLTGLLSSDYVDVTGNGITEDDLGEAVKFNYSKNNDYTWRTPLASDRRANLNPGNRTSNKDDKGLISYGVRESWYMHSIESKNMIALFILEGRADGKAATNALDGINYNDDALKRLKRIDLYNKADLKKNGLDHARPVKSVHFQYSYALCGHHPGNNANITEMVDGQNVNSRNGKLTLEKIYFTYNGMQKKANKSQYAFSYGDITSQSNNPDYTLNASDRWGTFKHKSSNPQGLTNAVYPYTLQPQTPVAVQQLNDNAGAWALKKILLPSGGQLEVEYENDDYAYVQNKRAAVMMPIAGFGHENSSLTSQLYAIIGNDALDNERVYIDVPVGCATKQEVKDKYLQGVSQLAFKLAVRVGGAIEFISAYAEIEDYDVVLNQPNRIWVKLRMIDGVSPLALSTVEFIREQLPGQIYPGYDVSDGSSMQQVGAMLAGMWDGLKNAFRDPFRSLRVNGVGQRIDLAQSFVRINEPGGRKYGGGNRVSRVIMKDNWDTMTHQYQSMYGQVYDYNTVTNFAGKTDTISSGVASYEPSIGGDENPFQTIQQVANKLPMGPATYGAIEMPVLDAFFPAPVVGYSKVTVKSLRKGTTEKKSRSGIGRQVTEFYTARDFPVYYSYTPIDPGADKQLHQSSLTAFFYKHAFDSRAITQGFLVATNDMHGKMKSQSSYGENDTATRINYTENFYRNTGAKGLNEKFDFVHSNLGGEVKAGNMGIDIELMTDAREFSVKNTSLEIQAQVDLFPVVLPFWLPFIWGVSGDGENTYRAVTTTKVINYHSILDSVVVIDKGSQVSTRNLVFDAETGILVVSRTNNAYDKPLYSTNYPAWWAYSGMGPAYRNLETAYTGINFLDGKIVAGVNQQDLPRLFESGDELYVTSSSPSANNCGAQMASGKGPVLWAFDKLKNSSSLSQTTPDFIFLDSVGKPFTMDNVSFRIIRSGKRNMLDASLAAMTSMVSPVNSTTHKLAIGAASKVINATAMEYREKWQLDNDLIRKLRLEYVYAQCTYKEVIDCAGFLEKSINPYRKGMVGNFRPYRNMVFYANRTETNAQIPTNLPENGFLEAFKPYWDFDANSHLVPDGSNSKWVWNDKSTRINAKGMDVESMNALNIYTAAQYGYNKTLPIAIANNSRSYEMAYEGFEDLVYDNTINGRNYLNSCSERHFNLKNLGNASIVNTDTTQFTAHTGKYVMAVGAHKEASQQFAVNGTEIADTYDLNFKKDTSRHLIEPGSNVQTTPSPSYPNHPAAFVNIGTDPIVSIDFYDGILTPNSTDQNTYLAKFDFYMYMPQSQVYTFDLGMGTEPADYSSTEFYYNYLSVTLTNVDMPEVGAGMSVALNAGTYYQTGTAAPYLCAGMYHVEGSAYLEIKNFYLSSSHHWFWWAANGGSEIHKSITKEDGCISTLPLKAEPSMINPVYKAPADKKMLFSAWVRETCGNAASGIPCNDLSYQQNQVRLQFNDAGDQTDVPLKPAGPIIDGWQRVEGAFEVPVGATNMTLSFINNSDNPIYYDDIRMHPYNANMKSYVYDPVNLRLVAELDAENYATFYEYDPEGELVRTKVETSEGIKTIRETRSFKQKNINYFR